MTHLRPIRFPTADFRMKKLLVLILGILGPGKALHQSP